MHAKLSEKSGKFTLYAALVFALTAMACASGNQGVARKEIGSAQSSLNQAQASNAREYAPLELKMAQEKLAQANQELQNEEYKKAEYRAKEAAVDANLAQSKAQNAKTEKAVQALQQSIGQLRDEIQQNQTAQ